VSRPVDRERAAALEYVLAAAPEIPGVGRLCQELLADMTGQAVVSTADTLLRMDRRGGRPGHTRPPWTPERREKQMATVRRKRELVS